jgi:hypothetical protein
VQGLRVACSSKKNTLSKTQFLPSEDFAAPSLEFSGNEFERVRIKLREKENQLSA